MATLSTVNVKITGDTGQLVTSLTHAEGRVTTFASKVSGLNKVTNTQARGFSNLARGFTNAAGQSGVLNSEISILASSVGNVGLAAAGAGIGLGVLAGGLAASIASAISFETAITRVAKTANFSKEETKAFGDEILDMSRRLPVARSGLTDIAVVAGQLGIQGTANIATFVEEVAKLSSTTGVDVTSLATGLGTLTQIFQLQTSAVRNLSAEVTGLGNEYNSTETAILDGAVRLAGVGSALGIPAASILAISNAIASVMPDIEAGTSAVQRVLLSIDEAATGAEPDKLALFAEVAGKTVDEFQKLAAERPDLAFAAFVDGLGDIGNAREALSALDLDDVRVTRTLLSMAESQNSVNSQIERGTALAIEATATNTEFARTAETTAAKLQILKNNISATAVELGTVFLPAVDAALDALNGMFADAPGAVQNFKDNMSALADIIDTAADNTVAFNAAINAIPGVGAVDALRDAFDALGGSIGSTRDIALAFLSIVPGFQAAAGIIDAATSDFDTARAFVRGITGGNPPQLPSFTTTTNESVGDLLGFDARRRANVEAEITRRVPIPPGLLPKGPSGPEPLTIAKALSDHVITLFEALELGLSEAQVVALELADARAQETAEAFRTGVELNKLAALFPGLNGEQIQFALALAAIQQNMRETNRTAEEFKLAEAVGPELDRLQSRLQEVLGQPTRETLGLQRQKAAFDRRRLLILQGGAAEDDVRVEAIDREIEGLNNLIRLRETEVDIMRIDAALADQRTLTDAAQVTQTQVLTAAILDTSGEFVHLEGAAYRAAAALEAVAAGGSELSLRDALIALGGLPDHGASLIPQLDRGGVVKEAGLAIVDQGERFYNGGFGPRGESGIPSNSYTNNIYVTANTKNDAEEIARVISERLLREQRRSDRRGHFVTTGGGFP